MPSTKPNFKVTGYEKVIDLLDEVGSAAKALSKTTFRIQSDKPYTHFIEEGFYLNGRPGKRKAGPARMMAAGLDRIKQLLRSAIVRNIEKGATTLLNAVSGVMGEGTKATRAKTPVVSGNLRASMHTVRSER